MLRRPPRSKRTDTLFPYTTLFRSLGFYCIVNHGVPQALIDDSFDQVAALFALPLETKMKYRVDYHHQGYIPTKATVLRWSKIAKNEDRKSTRLNSSH